MSRIRLANPDEALHLLRLIQATLPARLWPCTIYACPGAEEYLCDRLHGHLQQPEGRFFVAIAGMQIVGFAEWRRYPDGLFLNHVYVAPEHRHHGLGRRLLAEGLKVFGADSIPVHLDVIEENEPAKRWYAGLGLRPVQRTTWHLSPLPSFSPHIRPADVRGLRGADHSHARYGFSTIEVRTPHGWLPVGRLGTSLFRLTEATLWRDAAALAMLHQLDPSRYLLCIGPEQEADFSSGEHVATSVRMATSAAALQRALA